MQSKAKQLSGVRLPWGLNFVILLWSLEVAWNLLLSLFFAFLAIFDLCCALVFSNMYQYVLHGLSCLFLMVCIVHLCWQLSIFQCSPFHQPSITTCLTFQQPIACGMFNVSAEDRGLEITEDHSFQEF